MENILSWLIWLPIIGMVAIAFIPRDKEDVIKITAAVATGLQFLLTLVLWQNYDAGNGSMQFMERAEWIPSFNITYILGVDGLSLPMAILTALLCFIGVFVSWNINKAVKGYFALFLLLDTGIMGASTWAKGSQVWKGKTGTLMANPINKSIQMTLMALIPHHMTPFKASGATRMSSRISNVFPQVKYRPRIPINMSTEPNKV